MKKYIMGNRRAINAAKELGIEIHEVKELYNAYGSHYFYRTTEKYIELNTPSISRKFNSLVAGKIKKAAPVLTEEEKTEKWVNRLAKLTGITHDEAVAIANEKENYKQDQINMMIERDNNSPYGASVRRGKLIAKMERENPLRYIKNEEHAQNILAASERHNNSDYEDKLEEGRELAASGDIDRAEVKEYARNNMQFSI